MPDTWYPPARDRVREHTSEASNRRIDRETESALREASGGWGALFITQIGFLGHHALRSWCPPMPVFRRLGFRSTQEIAAERAALANQLAQIER